MEHDVDVFITTDTPDDDDSMLNGPLSGGLCETFALCEKIAQECGGGWGDWEPYRCTFGFSNKEQQDEFFQQLEERKEIQDRFVTYKKR